MKTPQREMVLSYIMEHGSITDNDARRDLGISRLASRISELKKMGYPIKSTPEAVKTRYGKTYVSRYSMEVTQDEVVQN